MLLSRHIESGSSLLSPITHIIYPYVLPRDFVILRYLSGSQVALIHASDNASSLVAILSSRMFEPKREKTLYISYSNLHAHTRYVDLIKEIADILEPQETCLCPTSSFADPPEVEVAPVEDETEKEMLERLMKVGVNRYFLAYIVNIVCIRTVTLSNV